MRFSSSYVKFDIPDYAKFVRFLQNRKINSSNRNVLNDVDYGTRIRYIVTIGFHIISRSNISVKASISTLNEIREKEQTGAWTNIVQDLYIV